MVYQTHLGATPTFQTGKGIEKIEFCSFKVVYYTPKCVLFCPLQVVLYPTSSSSKSAELHRMIVPKNSQDSDLKIKLAVRMDKPPHMKHSGWVCTWRGFSSELLNFMVSFLSFSSEKVSGIHMEFPPPQNYIHEKRESESISCSLVSNSLHPHGL